MSVELHWREWGMSSGVTAVLIHGVADGSFVWNEFAPALAQHCRVIAPDLRGHGASDHDPHHCYTLERFLADVRALLEKLQLQDIVLIGHSLGGEIATYIAPELGTRLRALVVVDAGPGSDEETAAYLQQQLRDAHRPYASIAEYADWLADRRHLIDASTASRIATDTLRLSPDGRYWPKWDPAVLDIITAKNDDEWWLPALARTMAPVLVVRGVASAALSRKTATTMRAAARAGDFVEIPRSGHAVMTDNADGFLRAVIPFVVAALAREGFG